MCDLCDESSLGYVTCPDCGKMICFDSQNTNCPDEVAALAVVTEFGDLLCVFCNRRDEEARAELERDEFAIWWEAYPGELLATAVNFDTATEDRNA